MHKRLIRASIGTELGTLAICALHSILILSHCRFKSSDASFLNPHPKHICRKTQSTNWTKLLSFRQQMCLQMTYFFLIFNCDRMLTPLLPAFSTDSIACKTINSLRCKNKDQLKTIKWPIGAPRIELNWNRIAFELIWFYESRKSKPQREKFSMETKMRSSSTCWIIDRQIYGAIEFVQMRKPQSKR